VYALDFGNQKSYVSGSATANSLKYDPAISASILTFGGATIPNLQNGLLKLVRGADAETGSRIDLNKQFFELRPTSSFTIQTMVGATSNTSTFLTQNGIISDHKGVFGFLSTVLSGYGNPLRYTITKNLPSGLKHITYRYSSGSYDLFVNGVPTHTTGRNTPVTGNSGNFTMNGRR